jgi:hypothetical protein
MALVQALTPMPWITLSYEIYPDHIEKAHLVQARIASASALMAIGMPNLGMALLIQIF